MQSVFYAKLAPFPASFELKSKVTFATLGGFSKSARMSGSHPQEEFWVRHCKLSLRKSCAGEYQFNFMLSSNAQSWTRWIHSSASVAYRKKKKEKGGRGQGLIRLVVDKHIANAFLWWHRGLEGHSRVWLVKEDFLNRQDWRWALNDELSRGTWWQV